MPLTEGPVPPRPAFFRDAREDDALEARSQVFWDSLNRHVEGDAGPSGVGSILDIGCHRGGLLELLARRWHPTVLEGIEPIAVARARATIRLRPVAQRVAIHGTWDDVAESRFDLMTCHEVLYLESDLRVFFERVARHLLPNGRAYVVLGCHTENPLWAAWSAELVALGHEVFHHAPLDVMRAGAKAGLSPAVRPLRDPGWAVHDPLDPGFAYPSVGALLDHQFRHKLLFRFTLR